MPVCTRCGNILENQDRFCSRCGHPVTPATLPQGMFYTADGFITWRYQDKDFLRQYFMNPEKVILRLMPKDQPDPAASAFKDFVKSGFALAADQVMMNSDSYSGMDTPWDDTEKPTGTEYCSEYRLLQSIKVKSKKHYITLERSNYPLTLYMYPQQFDFVRDYIIRHCPGIKVKEGIL